MSNKKDSDFQKEIQNAGAAFASSEVVSRYGSANAEYIKGYSGSDNETGKKFSKGLKDIYNHKVNHDPVEAAKNIKQQAGFSAEIATTSRDNAESIIDGSRIRTSRSDDLPQYGRNHNIVDRVQILDGKVIEGSQAQMKFVGDRDHLFKKIAEFRRDGQEGEFARYQGVKLELPSEQFEGASKYCKDRAEEFRINAEHAERAGKPETAAQLRRTAENYDQLAANITDSGMTTEQAIFYREHPKIATALDIAKTSHRAGLEGAQYGAIIGGTISLVRNIFSLAQEEKGFSESTSDFLLETTQSAAVGYATAFAGSAIKGGMQQSSTQGIRALAGTNAPVLVVNVCLSLGGSIKRYAQGEITESQLLAEVGEKSASMLSSGMMAALGQLLIPVPFVGAAIGGMIGCTLSSIFYQSALDSARGAEISRQRLAETQQLQAAARESIKQQQQDLENFLRKEIPQLFDETRQLFSILNQESNDIDAFAEGINLYATLLGKELQFQSLQEFDEFMLSDQSFKL